jgi:hypothetical protein
MKKRIRLLSLLPIILVIALLTAVPTMAGATRTEFTAWDIPGDLSGGRTWMENGYLYMRNMEGTTTIAQLEPEEDLNISGAFMLTLNANIDLTTGCGHFWGKAVNENWIVSYQGEMCIDSSGNPISFRTKGVGKGKGELKDLHMRYDNVNGFMTGYILETPD